MNRFTITIEGELGSHADLDDVRYAMEEYLDDMHDTQVTRAELRHGADANPQVVALRVRKGNTPETSAATAGGRSLESMQAAETADDREGSDNFGTRGGGSTDSDRVTHAMPQGEDDGEADEDGPGVTSGGGGKKEPEAKDAGKGKGRGLLGRKKGG